LKRNFGYWLLSYHKKEFEIFANKSKAVVEHHFNNHSHCDDWCSMKKASATVAATGNLKYRCKKENSKLYKQIVEVMDRFTNTEKLQECHHGFSSQKNESMNKVVSRYVPKDRTFCQSMSLTSRICMAVGIDSIGHEDYYQRVFGKMEMKLPVNLTNMLFRMKNRREYDRNYQAQPKRKRKRSETKLVKIKEGLQKQMADKAVGRLYETGNNMGLTTDEVTDGAGERRPKKAVSCIFCGGSTHKTRRSKECKYYGWAKTRVEAEMVSISVSRATRVAVGVATATATSGVHSEGTCELFGFLDDTDYMHFCWY
jgi:hypothetical protein